VPNTKQSNHNLVAPTNLDGMLCIMNGECMVDKSRGKRHSCIQPTGLAWCHKMMIIQKRIRESEVSLCSVLLYWLCPVQCFCISATLTNKCGKKEPIFSRSFNGFGVCLCLITLLFYPINSCGIHHILSRVQYSITTHKSAIVTCASAAESNSTAKFQNM